MGVLYVCATPIGHLGDVSFRLLDTLREVDLIAAEDTRVTHVLLRHFDISKPLVSVRQHNEGHGAVHVLAQLQMGKSVAYVSDAGTPGLCDPGQVLVQRVREAGHAVVPIAGPSAVATFLSVIGVSLDKWLFGGFFPRKITEAEALFKVAQTIQVPLIFFESPLRIHHTIETIVSEWALDHLAFGKELTKQFERVWSGLPTQAAAVLNELPKKGEWIFAVFPSQPIGRDVAETVAQLYDMGLSHTQVGAVCQSVLGLSRNDVYRAVLAYRQTNEMEEA